MPGLSNTRSRDPLAFITNTDYFLSSDAVHKVGFVLVFDLAPPRVRSIGCSRVVVTHSAGPEGVGFLLLSGEVVDFDDTAAGRFAACLVHLLPSPHKVVCHLRRLRVLVIRELS